MLFRKLRKFRYVLKFAGRYQYYLNSGMPEREARIATLTFILPRTRGVKNLSPKEKAIITLNIVDAPWPQFRWAGQLLFEAHASGNPETLIDPDFVKTVADRLCIGSLSDSAESEHKSSNSVSGLVTLTEVAFGLAHEYVNFRNDIERKAGGLFGMFRKVNYSTINVRAVNLEQACVQLREKVRNVGAGNENLRNLAELLPSYVDALCVASGLTRQKTELLLQLSEMPGSISWEEFQRVANEEEKALIECQSSGQMLTTAYRLL